MTLRASIIRACEALEDGDELYAAEILRDAIENFDGEPIGVGALCPICGLECHWAGLADHHLRFTHGVESEAAA